MADILLALMFCGCLGMLGQGVRAIVGLKGLSDAAVDPTDPNPEVFRAARLVVSLLIGFIAGALAAIAYGLAKLIAAPPTDTTTLLGFMAAGYSGTDFIEGFMTKYLPGQDAPAPVPAARGPAQPMQGAAVQPAPASGDGRVKAACEAQWDANKSDCSGFVRAVAADLGATVAGDADDIVTQLRSGVNWEKLPDGPAAAKAAQQGRFVLCGLKGSEQAVPDVHGHVAVIVDGPLNRGKYPPAYWGRLNAVGAKNQTINWAWTTADRDHVTYAAYEP